MVFASVIVAAVVAIAAGLTAFAAGDPDLTRATPTPQSAPSRDTSKTPEFSDPWQKRWWIEKTARLLRGGEGLTPREDIAKLEKLSKEDIAREFMKDERFGDTVLDFNMYFLGFKVDSLKVDGEYVHAAYDFANAISSAKALLKGGDYLKLFDLEGEYYLEPLSVQPTEEKLSPEDAKLAPQQLRKKAVDEVSSRLRAVLAMRKGPKALDAEDFCGEIEELTEGREETQAQLFRAFTDTEIFVLLRVGIPDNLFNALQGVVEGECEKPRDKADVGKMEGVLRKATERFDREFKQILTFEPANYMPETVAALKPLDPRAFATERKWPAFGFEQGTALANSSTNFNRKRAAYVLKRFFCDDLNPVGFDDPKEHVGGAHGSQTSCYSCHYKLDPMAGFFRNYGALFSDSSDEPDIVFDDLASMDRKKYLSTWQAPKESHRKWQVGYIRSPRWTAENSYGESLGDLSRIIRNAPEAKRCLMRRLSQYVLGDQQTVDGGYLDALTKSFTQDAAANSSTAFKNAMLRLLTSQTFETRNPDPRQCYDHSSKTAAGQRPPCRVAYILEKNCVQCHGENDGLNTLLLNKWIDAPSGKGKTFEHLDSKDNQLPATETLEQMANRLSSSDPKVRMPKNKPMSSQERQELYLWVQKQLAQKETN